MPLNPGEDRLEIQLIAGDNTLDYQTNAAGTLFQQQRIGGSGTWLPTVAAATLKSPGLNAANPMRGLWWGILTIPWSSVQAVALGTTPADAATATLSLTLTLHHPSGETVTVPGVDIGLTLYDGITNEGVATDHLQNSADNAQQYVAFSELFKSQFTTLVSATPQPTPSSSPAPLLQRANINVNVPLKDVLAGFTVTQNDADLQDAVSKITTAALTAVPTAVPSLAPCASCQPFQTLYGTPTVYGTGAVPGTIFGIAKASSGLTLFQGAKFGGDDEPFNFANISNLDFGGTMMWTAGNLTVGGAEIHSTGTTSQALTDGFFGGRYSDGVNTYDAMAIDANHPGPLPVFVAGMPYVAPVEPHVVDDAFSWYGNYAGVNSRADGQPSTTAFAKQFNPLIRLSVDQTDSRINGFAGLQDNVTTTALGPRGLRATSWSGALGYRASGVGYQEPDGDPVTLPGVSGPVGALTFAGSSTSGRYQPSFALNGFSLTNSHGESADFYQGSAGLALTPFVNFGFQTTQLWLTEALLVNQTLSDIGPDVYPYANDPLIPLKQPVIPLETEIVSGGYTNAAFTGLNVGWDFRNVTSTCTVLQAGPALGNGVCNAVPTTTRNLTVAGFAAGTFDRFGNVTIAGSYAPTIANGQSRFVNGTRAYNAILTYQPPSGSNLSCISFRAATTNDTGLLSFQSGAYRQTLVELDDEGVTRVAKRFLTLAIGYSDSTTLMAQPSAAVVVPGSITVPYAPSYQRTIYLKAQVATAGLKKALNGGCAH